LCERHRPSHQAHARGAGADPRRAPQGHDQEGGGGSHDEPEFAEAVKAAEADSQQELLKKIWTASDQQWQAAAWMLERRWPQDFARRQALEMSGPDGGPIETASRPAELSDEELRDALRARLTTPSEDGAAAEAAGAPADSRLHALPD
jgi:hypothetical protein